MSAARFFTIFWTALWMSTLGDVPQTNGISTNRVLRVDRCSTTVAGARATLNVGVLRRTGDVYEGDYEMKVWPYFFKSEKGKLAIVVTDENIANADKGLTVDIMGTATTNEKNARARRIDAKATPLEHNRGALKLWFFADKNKLIFDTSYSLAED